MKLAHIVVVCAIKSVFSLKIFAHINFNSFLCTRI